MKSKIIWLIIVLILAAYIFAKANPNNPTVIKVQNMLGLETTQIMTGLTDTGEVLPEENKTGIANPASTYCIEQWGILDIRTGPNGWQIGYCMFDNGNECEEWAFFRGECKN